MLKQKLSLILVLAMVATMFVSVGMVSAAIPAENQTSIIFDEGFETNDKALAFFNQTSGNRLNDGGINGTLCAVNQKGGNSGLFHSADFTHNFKPSKRYYVTFLVKPLTEAAVSKNLIVGLLGSLSNTGSNAYPLPSLSRTVGWNGATIYNSMLVSEGWNLVGARIDTGESVSAEGASMQDYLAGAAGGSLAANSILVDNYIVIEEDPSGLSGTNSSAVRPVAFDAAITRTGEGALVAGETLTASAFAYEVNLTKKTPAAVYFDWYRSEDGESWELIGERQTGTLNTARNAYGTFDATGTYTVTEEDAGCLIKAEAVAMTRNNKYGTDVYSTDFGDKAESAAVGQLPEITVSYDSTNGRVESNGETIEPEYTVNARSITLDIKPNAGYKASAEVNGQNYEISNNQLILSGLTADASVEIIFTASSVRPSVSFKQSEVVLTTYNGAPAWVVYVLPDIGSGYTVSEYGAIVSDGTVNLRLKAMEDDKVTPSTDGAAFGIKVFGDAFNTPGTYSFRPFITFVNGESTEDATVEHAAEFIVSE